MGILNEYKPNYVEVASDAQGMMSSALEEKLANWPKDQKKPKLIYTIPTGANPSGTCASEPRKKELLQIAKKYDLLLCEDDAYYYLVRSCACISKRSTDKFHPVLWTATTSTEFTRYGVRGQRRNRSCDQV